MYEIRFEDAAAVNDMEARLVENSIRASNGCWYWIGPKARNRPMLRVQGHRISATRLAYAVAHGWTAQGRRALCRNGSTYCANPDHMELL